MLSIRPKLWLLAMPAIIYLTIIYEPVPGIYPAAESSNGAVVGLIVSLVLFTGLLLVRANLAEELPTDQSVSPPEAAPAILPKAPQMPFTLYDILFIAGAAVLLILFFVVVFSFS